MTTGTVKWFNTQKGFGFIQPDDGSKDAFLHISALARANIQNVDEGQRLSFDLVAGQGGKMAADNISLEA